MYCRRGVAERALCRSSQSCRLPSCPAVVERLAMTEPRFLRLDAVQSPSRITVWSAGMLYQYQASASNWGRGCRQQFSESLHCGSVRRALVVCSSPLLAERPAEIEQTPKHAGRVTLFSG